MFKKYKNYYLIINICHNFRHTHIHALKFWKLAGARDYKIEKMLKVFFKKKDLKIEK